MKPSPLERELALATCAILAAEDWAHTYANAPEQHAQLIKLTARLHLLVLRYLRSLAKQAPALINWFQYSVALTEQQRAFQATQAAAGDGIQAYDINVVINQDALSQQEQQLIKIVFDTLATVMASGAASAETEHGMPIGLSSTSAIIQQLTTKQLANLVGMKVNRDGTIVPNPNPAYNITETTRSRIAQSVQTSIRLGEDHTQAVKRLQTVIADADRADMIARTETVRAFATGRAEYARQSNATGKFNVDSNATDICADNTAEGTIPVDQDFVSGDPHEPYHPNCRCQTVYVYGDTPTGD